MFARGVVEYHHVAAVALEESVFQEGEEQHAAGASAGELDDMRESAVTLRSVSEGIGPVRVVALGVLQPAGEREFGYRLHRHRLVIRGDRVSSRFRGSGRRVGRCHGTRLGNCKQERGPRQVGVRMREAAQGSSLSVPVDSVAAEGHAVCEQGCVPAVAGADAAGRVEQAQTVLVCGQASEAAPGRVVGGDEELLAMEHGWVRGAGVVAVVEVEPLQIRDDGALEGGMRHAFEVLVGEVRDAGLAAGQLDEGEPLHGAGELAAAPFVDAQHRGKVLDGVWWT